MPLLDDLRNAFQRPCKPAGNTAHFKRLRDDAYREIFEGEPLRVLSHEDFGKPANMGGRIDVHLYEMEADEETGPFFAAVTSGMSDYRMIDPESRAPVRREVVQYLRTPNAESVSRVHDLSWVPLAAGFCLDFYQTAGPHPSEYTGALFLPPLVSPHDEFALDLDGEEMRLLWYVPLREKELAFKLEHGVDALLERLEAANLPVIFDPACRPDVV